jgi:hypothetical protein
VWTPIYGRYGKSYLIKTFFDDIASNLTTQFDLLEPAPKKPVGRPRGPRLAGDSGSASSASGEQERTVDGIITADWIIPADRLISCDIVASAAASRGFFREHDRTVASISGAD